jgi:hypothetical protein
MAAREAGEFRQIPLSCIAPAAAGRRQPSVLAIVFLPSLGETNTLIYFLSQLSGFPLQLEVKKKRKKRKEMGKDRNRVFQKVDRGHIFFIP